MSLDDDAISPVESVGAHSPEVWAPESLNAQLLKDIYSQEVETSPLSTHLQAVAEHLGEQKVPGVGYQHTEDFFHRFMRSAPGQCRFSAIEDEPELNRFTQSNEGTKRSNAPGSLPRPSSNRQASTRAAKFSAQFRSKADQANSNFFSRLSVGREFQADGRPKPSFLRRYIDKNPTSRLVVEQPPSYQGVPLEPKYYGTLAYRKSFSAWLKLPYNAKHFDHRTTFFPVELKPPPDIDFIPFELFASLGIMVGWQWLIDQYIRSSFVSDRYAADDLEIFLANYSLLGVKPADGLQGAVAHYPSEEQQRRILEYLNLRHRSKARMRIELLNRQGDTVADVWVEYGIVKRAARDK